MVTVELNQGRLRAKILDFGARLVELWVPDHRGRLADIVLGHETPAHYRGPSAYFGATCGRVANRIAGSRFDLDGRTYRLPSNEGGNHLHGGSEGFDRKTWRVADRSSSHVILSATSADGEMGYPGYCDMEVTYRLTEDLGLDIEMTATCDAPTPMNMVNHSYFNLSGNDAGVILDHELTIFANAYLPVGDGLIPTGSIDDVAGTPFDFRKPRRIGSRIAEVLGGRGYDHNWCLADGDGGLKPAARVRDPSSGRTLGLSTSEPGLQLYAGGYLREDFIGKNGRPMKPFDGFTLETQGYPNAINEPEFPNVILRPGERYRHAMAFRFGVTEPGP